MLCKHVIHAPPETREACCTAKHFVLYSGEAMYKRVHCLKAITSSHCVFETRGTGVTEPALSSMVNAVIFGATGFLGRGVLRECLLDPRIESVLSITRRPSHAKDMEQHPKLKEVVTDSFTDYTSLKPHLGGVGACFWCLGTASGGLSEAEYTKITVDMPVAAAKALLDSNPPGSVSFLYLSGAWGGIAAVQAVTCCMQRCMYWG